MIGGKRPKIAVAIVIVVAAGTPWCAAQDGKESRIRDLAQPYLDAELLVGLSIGVIQGGNQTAVHLGELANGGGRPDSDTLYEIGSMSKVFTGLLLADAVNRGAVRLDQPAQELMPDGATMPAWKDRPIALVDIATHSSGLPRLADNMPSLKTANPYADYTSKLALDFLGRHRLRREPGTKYEYSNLGASFLGYLICSHAGSSYDGLLAKRICGPLGMNDTRVVLTDEMKSRLAVPHVGPGNTTVNWEFADLPGAGGIRSSTRDMLRFAAACLEPPENEVGRAIELSWKKHRQAAAGEPAMGLGWHVAGDGRTRWHNGQTGGYHSMILVNRPLNAAVVLLTNTASMEADALANSLIRMLAGQEVKPREFDAAVKVSPEVMERYVGRYELAPTFIFDEG